MPSTGKLVFYGIVIAIAASIAGFFGIRNVIRSNHLAPFKPHVQEYLALANAASSPKDAKAGHGPSARIKGKVIPVSLLEQDIDWIYFDLPESLVANKPEEVGAVLLLQWGKRKVAEYSDGRPANVQTCNLTIVDAATKTIVAQQAFEGGPPPQNRKRSQSGDGPKPTKNVVNYVQSIPRE